MNRNDSTFTPPSDRQYLELSGGGKPPETRLPEWKRDHVQWAMQRDVLALEYRAIESGIRNRS